MKLTKLIFYFFIITQLQVYSQNPLSDPHVLFLPDDKESHYVRGDCGSGNSNLPYFLNICDINSWTDEIHFDYYFNDCGSLGCEVRNAYIVLNDKVLKTKLISAPAGFMKLSYLDFKEAVRLEVNNGESEFCFKIKYDIVCPGGIVFTSFFGEFVAYESCIPLLEVGDSYERIICDENISKIINGNCIEHPAFYNCCPVPGKDNPEKIISIVSTLEFQDEASSEIKLQLDGTIKNGNHSLKIPIAVGFKFVSKEVSKYVTTVASVLKVTGEAGKCKSIRPRYLLKEVYRETGIIPKCNEEPDKPMLEFLGYDVAVVTYSSCVVATCPEEDNFFVMLNEKKRGDSRENCTGDIQVDLPPGSEDYALSYEWTGPNGFTSVAMDLTNVPYGTYTVMISDECCNHYQFSYTLCDSKEYGDYKLDGDNLCRTVICADDGCEFEDEECVPATICNSSQNLDNCVIEYCIDGSVVLSVDGAVNFKVEYDEINDLCVRNEYCNDALINSISELPIYGLWQVNEIENLCFRYITCYDEDIENLGVLSTEDSYNNIGEYCELIHNCGGDYVSESIVVPFQENTWTYVVEQGCEKEIICIDGNSGFTINGIAELYDLKFDAVFQECLASVKCDDDFIVEGDFNAIPIYIDAWDYNTDGGLNCFREVTCSEGVVLIDYQEGLWLPVGICPTDDNETLYVLQCGQEITDIEECILDTEPRQKFIKNIENVFVYPTTASDHLNIVDPYDLIDQTNIYNSLGYLIDRFDRKEKSLDVSSLSSGVYFINFRLKTGKINSHKFIKL
ncbi:MAG: hypothetical protein ACJA1A_002443 [Saprospiraceae bacterium]|jgi:hypothetical protein